MLKKDEEAVRQTARDQMKHALHIHRILLHLQKAMVRMASVLEREEDIHGSFG